jgi:alkylhydroperoxidase family enzyme
MIVSRMTASTVQRQVRHVTPVPPGDATGVVAQAYAQIADEMRLVIPPALMHSPSPRALAAYWMLMRESLLVGELADRARKEAVAAAVAVATICPYCVDMHTVSMYELSGEHDAEHLGADRITAMHDPRIREISAWARTAHQTPGPALPAGLTAAQRSELIGTLTAMHYLTRTVNVFLANFLLPPVLVGRARRRMKQGLGRLLRSTLRAPRAPGRSVGLLPAADLPADLRWAADSPDVARAMAGAAATYDAAAGRWLSPEVRAVVGGHLDRWQGEETGISTAWCEDALAGLDPDDRATGRLALLTAVASHQVGDETVATFRDVLPGDAALVEVTGWAAFEAARRIGARQPDIDEGARKETHPRGTAEHDGSNPDTSGVLTCPEFSEPSDDSPSAPH